jgi:hypothetical protein
MSTSLIPDPFQMWREALTKLEGNVNSLVTERMDTQDLMRSVHQLSTLSLGMQQAFEKAIGSYLARVNLPSRKEVGELAAALQRVEDKLDRLLPASAAAASAVPRPARTRRPPPEEVASSPAEAPTANPVRPAKRAAKGTSARATKSATKRATKHARRGD